MLSASHWLLAQARFCGRTHLPLSPNSTTPTVQVIFWYLRPDAPVFNIRRIHNNCGHGEISAITLLILSLSGCSCVNILWYTAPVGMMTFQWSHRSYQSICQQHPPYSHPQVTLIYYTVKQDFNPNPNPLITLYGEFLKTQQIQLSIQIFFVFVFLNSLLLEWWITSRPHFHVNMLLLFLRNFSFHHKLWLTGKQRARRSI